MKKEKWGSRSLGIILYVIPIIFLAVTYILMTVAAEDIFQGAGTDSDFISGALNAFRYDSRFSDMYAWSVIRAFDYQFSFGIDTLFRLIDVAISGGIIYIITMLILARRPGLRLKDGAVFATVFFIIFANNNYESLYLAFSNVHNYLIIGFFTLLFSLPFGWKLLNRPLPKNGLFTVAMFLCGFMFGFSCNITPAAFLLTLIIVFFFAVINKKINWSKFLRSWEFASVLGIAAACILMYGVGNGFSAYTGSSDYLITTDYISFSELLAEPVKNIPRVLSHIVDNFRDMAPCCIAIGMMLIFEVTMSKKGNDKGGVRLVGCGLLFVVAHTLAMSQILVSSSMRLIMPAYFIAVAAVGHGIFHMLELAELSEKSLIVYGIVIGIFVSVATTDMAVYRINYNRSMAEVLEGIRQTEGDIAYVSRSALEPGESGVFGFTQYPLILDWTLEKPIYGKYVVLID